MISWSIMAKLPTSPVLFYHSRYMDDEIHAKATYQKKCRLLGKKGFDVWLVRNDASSRTNRELVVDGPGWRDLYRTNPSNPHGVNHNAS